MKRSQVVKSRKTYWFIVCVLAVVTTLFGVLCFLSIFDADSIANNQFRAIILLFVFIMLVCTLVYSILKRKRW